MKKTKLVLSSVLVMGMLVSGLTGCSGSNSTVSSSDSSSSNAVQSSDEAITIEYWHSRPSGKHYDQLTRCIEAFNKENGKNITVKEVYQGDYVTCTAKEMQSMAAGTNAILTNLSITGFTEMASKGALTDLTPYAERDGIDMENFSQPLMEFSYYDGKLYSIPYLRSTAVFYYNQDLFSEVGYSEAPETMEELEDACKQIVKKHTDVGGYELLINDWYINTYLKQLGSEYINKDDTGMPCVEDGKLLKFFTDWKEGIDTGWCVKPNVTDASSYMKEQFYQGKIACFLDSSANIGDIFAACAESGINVAVAGIPYYKDGIATAPTGGSNLAIVGANHSEAEIEAAWEFIKYCASDENQYDNATSTGYLPVTYSATKTDKMQKFYEENPANKVAFDTLAANGHDYPFSDHLSETKTLFQNVASSLIIDGGITPEQAVEEIIAEGKVIFE